MPAPNAASLGKYGDYTVGNFTGVPEIGIPIYTVQEGPLSLPVSLSYHASGIKAAEMASWVGAGWSLNAGGIISRTVQGLPDEKPLIGYYAAGGNLAGDMNSGNPTIYQQTLVNLSTGLRDGEPDIFSFSVGGYSGKFYIDYSGAAVAYHFVPRQELKLDFDANFQGFTITTPDGTRYIFGQYQNPADGTWNTAQEKTYYEGDPTGLFTTSSWYLVRVETHDKQFNITLNYDEEDYSYYNNVSSKTFLPGNNTTASHPNTLTLNPNGSPNSSYREFITNMVGKKLKNITTPTTTVSFITNPSNPRQDMAAIQGSVSSANVRAAALDRIDISTGAGAFCQSFAMTYGYFQDPAAAFNTNYPNIFTKLRLDAVQQKSCSGPALSIPPYTFIYDGNALAFRLTRAIDHWGYPNGASNNELQSTINIPPTTVLDPLTGTPNTIGASNRESNEAEMKKGVLKEIDYPTGGKTTFVFEANSVPVTQPSPPVQTFKIQNCVYPGTRPAAVKNLAAGIIR